jgi:penicillin-insensitive murein endopeptidase
VAAFARLHDDVPDRTFVLGETGLKAGGRFPPHRTHQNGLSVDIFMPVRDSESRHVLIPTAPWNKFGYSLEFDSRGAGEGLTLDFESLAELLVEVHRQAALHALAVERIIVAPEYVDRVLAAKAAGIRQLDPLLTRKPAWVRHDEHVHIDFRLVSPRKPR